jgi:hypothetical protein
MAEGRTGGSRLRHFLLMLPFFLIGVAIPVYFFGFSGDGPPQMTSSEQSYSPGPSSDQYAPDRPYSDGYRSRRRGGGSGIVRYVRNTFEGIVDGFVSPNSSPLTIKLGVLAAVIIGGFFLVRLLLAAASGVGSFLIHKAAGPMFMGFLAVGSTWGIHQTVAEQFGLTWAAATASITAAIAALFALAGVRVR